MLLAGDIGGTKTHLAIYSLEDGAREPLVEARYPSDDYDSLETIASDFIARHDFDIHHACFGVAGPVVNGHVKTTNLPWEMDENALCHALKLQKVFLLNDLESVANAIPQLDAGDLAVLNEGQAEPGGSIGVIAPGTGLGEAYLTWDGSRYLAHPSEGGHTDFGPADDTQRDLLAYWQGRKGHVSYEWVCSGIGIAHIYEFFKETGYAPEPEWLAAELAVAEDDTPVIVKTAQEKDVPLCDITLKTFVAILAAESANLALKVLATGGVYLGGGIPPRILPLLQGDDFMTAFRHKGRFGDLLKRLPVRVILNPDAALMGAAAYGLARVQESG